MSGLGYGGQVHARFRDSGFRVQGIGTIGLWVTGLGFNDSEFRG